jgi:hypothetical protein
VFVFVIYFRIFVSMILATNIKSLNRSELLKLNKCLTIACSEVIGPSKTIVRTTKQNNRYYKGYFDIEDNKILIFRSNIKDIREYIEIFIHEWTHSCQMKISKMYSKMNSKYGYDKNPFEIEAKKNENKFRPKVWKIAKNLIKVS